MYSLIQPRVHRNACLDALLMHQQQGTANLLYNKLKWGSETLEEGHGERFHLTHTHTISRHLFHTHTSTYTHCYIPLLTTYSMAKLSSLLIKVENKYIYLM